MPSLSARLLLHITAALGIPAIGLTLWSWDQPLLCTCGTVHFWVGSIWSSENSQQIADWYTLAHFMHGLAVILMGRLLFKRLSFNALYVIAIASGVGWEIFEHSDFVIRQFRYGTVNQGYTGDSVLNAVSDYVFMMSGFYLARLLPTIWVAALLIGLETTATLVARDGFILEAIMLVHQFEAIEEWQLELKPDHLKN
jgi:hypothetical protein